MSVSLRRAFLLVLLTLAVANLQAAESKPFRKVLILSGGELRFSAGLAMQATLHRRGWVPDVTIYTCGMSKIPGAYLELTHPTPARSSRSGKVVRGRYVGRILSDHATSQSE